MKPEGQLTVSAWLDPENPSAQGDFVSHGHFLQRLYPRWYRLGDEGLASVHRLVSRHSRRQWREACSAVHVECWPSIPYGFPGGQGMEGGRWYRVLGDPRCARQHARSLARLASEDGVHGLTVEILDRESLEHPGWSGVLACLESACIEHQLGLNIALRGLPRLHLPAWEWSFRSLRGGRLIYMPLAPLAQPGAVLTRRDALRSLDEFDVLFGAVRREWGLPALGSFSAGGQVSWISWNAWTEALSPKVPALRDFESAQLHLSLEGREFWFCDSIAMLRLMSLARSHGICHMALESLGNEDPRWWEVLSEMPDPFPLDLESAKT